MYEQVFNLTSRPFTSSHYVKHFFAAIAIEQCLQQCKIVIDRGAGPVVAIGDHGTGKTLLLAMLEEDFKSRFRVVNLSAALFRGREDLLQNILYQLQLNCRGISENEMRLDLNEFLKGDDSAGILLMVDDAQKLQPETIEEIQLLADIIRDGQPQVRLVLAGSQGLEERLNDTRLVAFNQRIAGRCFLGCLGRNEVEAYVRAHLERAGGDPDELFSPDSFRAIYEVTEGRPRYINQVCDHAMIFSATRGIVPITDSLIREAWFDIQKIPGSIAPEGSGASVDDAFAESPRIEDGDTEGWTVLEFGELTEPVSSFEESAAEERILEAEAPQEETPQDEETFPTVDFESEEEIPVKAVRGPSFTVGSSGEVADVERERTAPETVEVATEQFGSAAPIDETPDVAKGAILAAAMSGPNAEDQEIPAEYEADEESAEQSFFEEAQTVEDEPVVEDAWHEADAVEQPAPEQPEPTTTIAEDPFASDSFENEEVLTDAYSPFVAQQNQRSLGITPEQIQDLTPYDDVDEEEALDEESFPTFETAMQPPEPTREPVKPQLEPREIEETRRLADFSGPNSLSEDFSVQRHAAEISAASLPASDLSASAAEDANEYVEAKPGSGFVPLDPDAPPMIEVDLEPTSQHTQTAADQTSAEVCELAEKPAMISPPPNVLNQGDTELTDMQIAELNAGATEASLSTPVEAAKPVAAPKTFHEHSKATDPDIRRQAEEIIRSLAQDGDEASSPVSQETEMQAQIQAETTAIENTIQQSLDVLETAAEPESDSPAVVMPDVEQIQESLRQAQEEQGYLNVPQVKPLAIDDDIEVPSLGKIPVQIANEDPVQAEREILEEVRDQSAMISPPTLSPEAGKDDLDIIEPQPPTLEAPPKLEQAVEALPAWSEQEPSRGEATRVDYQKLFDRLRNVQDNQD